VNQHDALVWCILCSFLYIYAHTSSFLLSTDKINESGERYQISKRFWFTGGNNIQIYLCTTEEYKVNITSGQTVYPQPTYTKRKACIAILPPAITYCTWHLFKYFKTQPHKIAAKEIVLYQNTFERYGDIQE